jgi:uncharacterized iron-regulated membrane protein
MKKIALLWVGLAFSVMAVLYCILWAIQSAWLSATPKYPLERAQFNANVSISLGVLFLVVSLVIGFFLYRGRKRSNPTIVRIQKIEDDAL